MEWLKSAPEEIWKYRKIIVTQVRLVDLIKEYGLHIESRSTGPFTHRVRCPFHTGKSGGLEKTPSLFVSDTTNSFNCFACCESGTVIDFVSKINGVPPVVALEQLAKRIGLIDKDGNWDELQTKDIEEAVVFDARKTIEPYLFEISLMLRDYIKPFVGTEDFEKELKRMEKMAGRVDEFLSQISHEDWEYAKDLAEKVRSTIEKKEK